MKVRIQSQGFKLTPAISARVLPAVVDLRPQFEQGNLGFRVCSRGS